LIDYSDTKYYSKATIKDPKILIEYAKKQKDKYTKSYNQISKELPEMQKYYLNKLSDVEIKYYEGVEETRKMMQELLNVKGELLGYSSWRKFEFLGEKWCKKLFDKINNLKDFKIEKLIV